MGGDVLCALSIVVHAIGLHSCVPSQTARPGCSQTVWMADTSIQPAKMAYSAGGASERRGVRLSLSGIGFRWRRAGMCRHSAPRDDGPHPTGGALTVSEMATRP